jgi:hypothetical protein
VLWELLKEIIKNPLKEKLNFENFGISIDMIPKYTKLKIYEIIPFTSDIKHIQNSQNILKGYMALQGCIDLIDLFYDLNNRIYKKIKAYKKQHQNEYIYYGYLRDYFWSISHFIGNFINNIIFSHPIIKKKKKKKILEKFLKRIKFSKELKCNYNKFKKETNIWDAYNIFTIYYKELLTYNEEFYDIHPALSNKTYNERIEERYKVKKGTKADSVNNLRQEIIKKNPKIPTNSIKKKLMDKLEDIILEEDYDQRFETKLNETKQMIGLFKKYGGLSVNEDSIVDLKVFYREIFVDDTQLDKLNQAMSIARSYIFRNQSDMEQDKYVHFDKTREYRFLLLKIGRGFIREAGILNEANLINMIQYCTIEILLDIFHSFDYDIILSDLHRATRILCNILKNILQTEWKKV